GLVHIGAPELFARFLLGSPRVDGLFIGARALERLLLLSARGAHRLPRADNYPEHEGDGHGGAGSESYAVPSNGFLNSIQVAGRTRYHRLVVKVALDVPSHPVDRFVAAAAVFL